MRHDASKDEIKPRIARLFTFLILAGASVSACHSRDVDTWYGYRLGAKLDASDVLGTPQARHGSRSVRLKPKGAWAWDEATAWIDPNDVIIAMDFEMAACETPKVVSPDPFARDTAKAPPLRCSRSPQQMTSFADDLRNSIKDRVFPHVLPVPPAPPPGVPFHPPAGQTNNNWSFREQFSGCDGHAPRYIAPYKDPARIADEIALTAAPDHVSLTVSIANMARYDSVRQSITPVDDDTERQKLQDQCAGRTMRYVGIARAPDSRTSGAWDPWRFGTPQYGEMSKDGYTVSPFKRAGVITSQDYDGAQGPDKPDSAIEWVAMTVSLDLNAAGTLTHCAITRSSGDLRLDDLSCRLIMERFRFHPARDEAGHPVAVQVPYRLTWPLPRSGNGNGWSGSNPWSLDAAHDDGAGTGASRRIIAPHPQPAIPLNTGSWDMTGAYPPGAHARHEQGVVIVDLTVSVDGRPIGCTVARSSNWSDLDDATCSYLRAHALFRPAVDGTGHAIVGHFQQRVKWYDPFGPSNM